MRSYFALLAFILLSTDHLSQLPPLDQFLSMWYTGHSNNFGPLTSQVATMWSPHCKPFGWQPFWTSHVHLEDYFFRYVGSTQETYKS